MLLWAESLSWPSGLGVALIIASGVAATALSRRTDTESVTD